MALSKLQLTYSEEKRSKQSWFFIKVKIATDKSFSNLRFIFASSSFIYKMNRAIYLTKRIEHILTRNTSSPPGNLCHRIYVRRWFLIGYVPEPGGRSLKSRNTQWKSLELDRHTNTP